MKPKNFPARRLKRKLKAMGVALDLPETKRQIQEARSIRTKKDRSIKKGGK